MGLRHWAMPPAGSVHFAAEREAPRTGWGAICCVGGCSSPVFVYKLGSACRETGLPFQAIRRCCGPERRGCRTHKK